MNLSAYWKPSLLLLAFAAAGTASSTAAVSVDTAAIAETIKTDVAKLVAEGCVEIMAAQEEWSERTERRELAHSEVLHPAALQITDFSDSSQRL